MNLLYVSRKAWRLSIESPPAVEILERRRRNFDFHSARLRSSRFAASQSTGCSLPAS
jgi:hypothetical protein